MSRPVPRLLWPWFQTSRSWQRRECLFDSPSETKASLIIADRSGTLQFRSKLQEKICRRHFAESLCPADYLRARGARCIQLLYRYRLFPEFRLVDCSRDCRAECRGRLSPVVLASQAWLLLRL